MLGSYNIWSMVNMEGWSGNRKQTNTLMPRTQLISLAKYSLLLLLQYKIFHNKHVSTMCESCKYYSDYPVLLQ